MTKLLIPSTFGAAGQGLRWPESLGQSLLPASSLCFLSSWYTNHVYVHHDWTRWGSTGLRNGLLIFSWNKKFGGRYFQDWVQQCSKVIQSLFFQFCHSHHRLLVLGLLPHGCKMAFLPPGTIFLHNYVQRHKGWYEGALLIHWPLLSGSKLFPWSSPAGLLFTSYWPEVKESQSISIWLFPSLVWETCKW